MLLNPLVLAAYFGVLLLVDVLHSMTSSSAGPGLLAVSSQLDNSIRGIDALTFCAVKFSHSAVGALVESGFGRSGLICHPIYRVVGDVIEFDIWATGFLRGDRNQTDPQTV